MYRGPAPPTKDLYKLLKESGISKLLKAEPIKKDRIHKWERDEKHEQDMQNTTPIPYNKLPRSKLAAETPIAAPPRNCFLNNLETSTAKIKGDNSLQILEPSLKICIYVNCNELIFPPLKRLHELLTFKKLIFCLPVKTPAMKTKSSSFKWGGGAEGNRSAFDQYTVWSSTING